MRRTVICALLVGLGALTLSGQAAAGTINVSTAAELQNAVSSAGDGDQIVLAQGDYAPETPLEIQRTVTISGPSVGPGARVVGQAVGASVDGSMDLIVVKKDAQVVIRNVAVTTTDTQGTAVNVFGTLSIENAEVSGNNGPGVWVQRGGRLTMTNSTISDNGSDGVIVDGTASIVSSTVGSNAAAGIANARGSVELVNSIVAGNALHDCLRKVTKSVTSLDGDGTCGANIKADPQLGLLADNGGPTATRALSAGSAAVDAGAGCGPIDQRMAPRTSACDIGAFEYGAQAPKPVATGGGSGASSGSTAPAAGSGSVGAVKTGSSPPSGRVSSAKKPTRVKSSGAIVVRGHRATFRFDLKLGARKGGLGSYTDRGAGIRLRLDRLSSLQIGASGAPIVARGTGINLHTGRAELFTLRLSRGAAASLSIVLRSYAAKGAIRAGRVQLIA